MFTTLTSPRLSTTSRHWALPAAFNNVRGKTAPIRPSERNNCQFRQANTRYKSTSPVPRPGKGPANRTLRIEEMLSSSLSNSSSRSGCCFRNFSTVFRRSAIGRPISPGDYRNQNLTSSSISSSHGGLPMRTSKPELSLRNTSGNNAGM